MKIKFFIILVLSIFSFSNSFAQEVNYTKYAKDLIGSGVETKTSEAGIKGQLQPFKYATISSEISGSIIEIKVKGSKSFKKNETLIEFMCNVERAELKKAIAVQNADKARLEVNTKLEKLSSISQLEYKLALFKAEESSADVDVISQRVKYCKIKAPYSGVVEELLKRKYEYVNRGDPVIKILDDSILEIELLIPSDWVTWLKEGDIFKVVISELSETYEAKVTNISAKIDSVSQSVKIKGSIFNKDKILKPGMSVTAHFAK